jgi:uncharacterized protein YggE
MSDQSSPSTAAARPTPPVDSAGDWRPRTRTAPRGAWFGATVVLVVLAIGAVGLLVGRSTRAGAAGAVGTITVTGTGTVQGVPDTLQFSVGVQTIRGSATAALTANDESMYKLEQTLIRYGVVQKDLQTSDLNIYENTNDQGQLTGFTVDETLNVTMNNVNEPGNLGKAGRAIEGAARSAGNGIQFNGISFSITNESTFLASARTKAMQDALTEAQQDATAGGTSVGGVVKISDVVNQQVEPISYGFPDAASSFHAAVPLESGTEPVSVQVTVTYALN